MAIETKNHKALFINIITFAKSLCFRAFVAGYYFSEEAQRFKDSIPNRFALGIIAPNQHASCTYSGLKGFLR